MMLFSAVLAGGHLLMAVAERVPQLNYEPICREVASGKVGIKDSFETCVQGESIAREKLGREWNGFNAADRASCVRSATLDHTASYVEVLTCLELAQEARKLHPKADAGLAAAEPRIAEPDAAEPAVAPPAAASAPRERVAAPVRRGPPHPDPVSLAPPEPPPAEAAPAYCLPGLAALIPACNGMSR
jgi:hypothetical protein